MRRQRGGMTPQDRLAAALQSSDLIRRYVDYADRVTTMTRTEGIDEITAEWTRTILAADPTIAADMELGRRIRDANDPLLRSAVARMVRVASSEDRPPLVDALRAALTEGEK